MGNRSSAATQTTLYRPKIDDAVSDRADLAEADPEIAEDGCTVTVKIKTGVKFSPPVDREVTSKDVKYAIERGFFNSVNNGYAAAYFGDSRAPRSAPSRAPRSPASRRRTTRRSCSTLTPAEGADKCAGGILARPLVMPLTAPVPEEYAKEFDAKNPSAPTARTRSRPART